MFSANGHGVGPGCSNSNGLSCRCQGLVALGARVVLKRLVVYRRQGQGRNMLGCKQCVGVATSPNTRTSLI